MSMLTYSGPVAQGAKMFTVINIEHFSNVRFPQLQLFPPTLSLSHQTQSPFHILLTLLLHASDTGL